MKIKPELQDGDIDYLDAVLVVTGIAGLLLINGLACYHLSYIMSDVASSVALLAAIGR
jgi:hypothetical protein